MKTRQYINTMIFTLLIMLCCIHHSYGNAGNAALPANSYLSAVSRTDCYSSTGFDRYNKGTLSHDKAVPITHTSTVQLRLCRLQ